MEKSCRRLCTWASFGEWGGFHYRITGVDGKGNLKLEGGWQNNRPSPLHKQFRFVENIFEELNVPGEWFADKEKDCFIIIHLKEQTFPKPK